MDFTLGRSVRFLIRRLLSSRLVFTLEILK